MARGPAGFGLHEKAGYKTAASTSLRDHTKIIRISMYPTQDEDGRQGRGGAAVALRSTNQSELSKVVGTFLMSRFGTSCPMTPRAGAPLAAGRLVRLSGGHHHSPHDKHEQCAAEGPGSGAHRHHHVAHRLHHASAAEQIRPGQNDHEQQAENHDNAIAPQRLLDDRAADH